MRLRQPREKLLGWWQRAIGAISRLLPVTTAKPSLKIPAENDSNGRVSIIKVMR